jgi:virginiamycin B lyase
MRRLSILAVALLAIGCSSHSSVPAPGRISPQIFQQFIEQNGWIYTPLKFNGQTFGAGGLAVDANHKVWALAGNLNGFALIKIAMDQHLTGFPLTITPQAIALGSDQNFWITGSISGKFGVVARVTSTGSETDYRVAPGKFLTEIVSGPDGALWFTECAKDLQSGGIGRITTGGSYTFFPHFCQRFITSGADGNIWFSSSLHIFKMTTQGEVIGKYSLGRVNIHAIATGSDGAIYVTAGEELIRITTDGTVTVLGGNDGHHMYSIVSGPDGNLWISSERSGAYLDVFDLHTSTWLPSIPNPSRGQIIDGPDDNIWEGDTGRVDTYVVHTMTATPKVLNVPVGQNANIDVSEADYAGQWTAIASKASIASVTMNSQNGILVVTGVAPGSTRITIYDSMFNSVAVKVTVTP